MYLWATEIPLCKVGRFVSVNRKTAGEMYARLRFAVATKYPRENMRLGGYNTICQVDESLFSHKPKYGRGRMPRSPIWVLGIADSSRTPAIGYMEIVPDRSERTLLPIIERICRPGTIIASDQWRGYLNITRELGLEHRTVNHSLNFVNPVDGTHTQNIESYWGKQKLRIKSMKGVMGEKLDEYLLEFMWRDLVGNDAFNNLINILKF